MFTKYCGFFSKNFKYIPDSGLSRFPLRVVCTHVNLQRRSRTCRVQKNHKTLRNNTILNEHPVYWPVCLENRILLNLWIHFVFLFFSLKFSLLSFLVFKSPVQRPNNLQRMHIILRDWNIYLSNNTYIYTIIYIS